MLWGVLNPIFCLSIYSSWVNLRLFNETQLYTLPGSALKVCVVGGWWLVLTANLVISFGFGQAEQNDYLVFRGYRSARGSKVNEKNLLVVFSSFPGDSKTGKIDDFLNL